jgi:hypothetical protein
MLSRVRVPVFSAEASLYDTNKYYWDRQQEWSAVGADVENVSLQQILGEPPGGWEVVHPEPLIQVVHRCHEKIVSFGCVRCRMLVCSPPTLIPPRPYDCQVVC